MSDRSLTPEHKAAMQAGSAHPETRAKASLPGFVPFAPGRLVGWIVNAETGCWEWTGRMQRGQAVVFVGTRPLGVVSALAARDPSQYAARLGYRPERTCATPHCVNPAHRVWLAPGEKLADVAKAKLQTRAAEAAYEAPSNTRDVLEHCVRAIGAYLSDLDTEGSDASPERLQRAYDAGKEALGW